MSFARQFLAVIIISLIHCAISETYPDRMKLQACDDDFRQMANLFCAASGMKTPCYKFYFDQKEWKDLYSQEAFTQLEAKCCQPGGCLISEIKQFCCLEPQCTKFCYGG